MRLLIISNYFYPEVGAAPYRIYAMAKGLAKQHKVEVVSPLPNYPYGKLLPEYKGKFSTTDTVEGVTVFRQFIYPSNSKKAVVRIIAMLSFAIGLWFSLFKLKQKQTIDVVIVQNSPLLVSFSAILLFKKLLRKKILLNVSDLWPGSAKDLGYVKEGLFYNLLKKIERFNYENADAIAGQSQEILDHTAMFHPETPKFLYRNIQPENTFVKPEKTAKFSIVYAGIIGVAQGILELLKHTNIKHLDLQFDIYGDGAEKDDILDYIKANAITNVQYKGMIPKAELNKLLPSYHFGLVPLATHIKGAVPSKIYDFVSNNVPVVYVGSGEAAHFITQYNLGYVVPPKAYTNLNTILQELTALKPEHYRNTYIKSCEHITKDVLNFDTQLENFELFLDRM